MNKQFQSALATFETNLNALITNLTTSPTASGAPTAALNLLAADDELSATIETLKQHQANYARILRLRAEAQSLEEKVKDVVRMVVQYERDIRVVCGDDGSDDESGSGTDSELDFSSDYDMEGTEGIVSKREREQRRKGKDEVDYKLLLDFARRISKYNHEAAADAAADAARGAKKLDRTTDTEMAGTNGTDSPAGAGAEPVAAVTKDATSWLDESANLTRQAYMLPYPTEERIRMGLMGQIQLAAAEGRPGFEEEKEVERLIREAEGLGVADAVVPPQTQAGDEAKQHAHEAANAAARAGSVATAGVAAAPKPKPKATLDLDLYDPEEDED